jgi:hypothetical protein
MFWRFALSPTSPPKKNSYTNIYRIQQDFSLWIIRLPCMQKTLGSIPCTTKENFILKLDKSENEDKIEIK